MREAKRIKMTPEMKAQWRSLSLAYDYGSTDKKISISKFREIWEVAVKSAQSNPVAPRGGK